MTGAHQNSITVKQNFLNLEVAAWNLSVEEDSVHRRIYVSRADSTMIRVAQGLETVAQRSAAEGLGGSTV
jgi:hypothetical protein